MEKLIEPSEDADSKPEWETPELIVERVADVTGFGGGGPTFDFVSTS